MAMGLPLSAARNGATEIRLRGGIIRVQCAPTFNPGIFPAEADTPRSS